jgi:hypothetical protein
LTSYAGGENTVHYNLQQKLDTMDSETLGSYEELCRQHNNEACMTTRAYSHRHNNITRVFYKVEYIKPAPAPPSELEEATEEWLEVMDRIRQTTLDHSSYGHYTFELAKGTDVDDEDQFVLRVNSRLMDPQFTDTMLLRMDSLISLTCTSNISFLCTQCFYLDQLVGRIVNGVRIAVTYYTGGQYGTSLNETMDFLFYQFDDQF